MANANTIANALSKSNAALVRTNPGGNNPWLFARADQTGALNIPAVLLVPSTAAQADESSDSMVGNFEPQEQLIFDGKPFKIRAAGVVTPNSTGKTLRIYLFQGNGESSLSSGSVADVQVGILSSVLPATGAAASNWYLEAVCIWDSLSQTLNGQLSGFINATALAATLFQVPNVAPGNLQFVLGVNLGATAAPTADTVTLNEFVADVL